MRSETESQISQATFLACMAVHANTQSELQSQDAEFLRSTNVRAIERSAKAWTHVSLRLQDHHQQFSDAFLVYRHIQEIIRQSHEALVAVPGPLGDLSFTCPACFAGRPNAVVVCADGNFSYNDVASIKIRLLNVRTVKPLAGKPSETQRL